MSFFGNPVNHLIASWGYIAVFGAVALEGFGLFFLPGETTLISAALVAGATGDLNILLVTRAKLGTRIQRALRV